MTSLTAVDLAKALDTIDNQGDPQEKVTTIIDVVCACTTDSSLSIDLRVACLLQILAVHTKLVYDNPHRRHILELIQERLEETRSRILTDYQITNKTQADEMCRRLSRVAEDAISELNQAISVYSDLSTLPRFRERLLKTLNSQRCKAAITPFIHMEGDAIEAINRCLAFAISYIEADVYHATHSYDEALNVFALTLDTFKSVTLAICSPIIRTLGRVRQDLIEHAEDNPHLQPAQLDIRADIRRYPLHEPDLSLPLTIQIVNKGQGTAIDVELEWVGAIGLKKLGAPVAIQSVAPGTMNVDILAVTDPSNLRQEQVALCEYRLHWVNSDGSSHQRNVEVFVVAQDTRVDWQALMRSNPYSLDAVRDPAHLLGRSSILNRLLGVLNTNSVGSVYIHGQKRVGKTSLANVALAVLEREYDVTTLFIDIGDILHPVPHRVVANLSKRIVERLNRKGILNTRAQDVVDDGTLGPLIDVLERLCDASHARRIVIALDEFDRLPLDLLQRNAVADTLFLGLRRLSSIEGIGLVLIGAERMQIVLNGPGIELNRFLGCMVDYIDRRSQWTDYRELIRMPTKGALYFTEGACERIYTFTQGNPFYTKQVCSKVLEQAWQRRDAFVDGRDVDAAIEKLLAELDSTSFSHYWEDFLLGDEERRNEVTVARRLCLLAYGAAINSAGTARVDDITRQAVTLGLAAQQAQDIVSEFVSRNILLRQAHREVIEPRIELFGRWIKGRGQRDIVIALDEHKAARSSIVKRREYQVQLLETEQLVANWSTYNGKIISGERVLEYLRQFGDEYQQRLIYFLLKGLTFVGVAEENAYLSDAYRLLEQGMKEKHGRWQRNQIRISYTGSVGKSSLAMARSFARTNRFIAKRDVVAPGKLRECRNDGVTDVVVVDDFCGSGDTLSADLEKFAPFVGAEQMLYLFVLAGTDQGIDRVEEEAARLFGQGNVKVRAMHSLRQEPDPFDERSKVFPSLTMAEDARYLVERFGKKLEPRIPLGYAEGCALIAFSRTIPNNAPPILWSSSSGGFQFFPLFPRH